MDCLRLYGVPRPRTRAPKAGRNTRSPSRRTSRQSMWRDALRLLLPTGAETTFQAWDNLALTGSAIQFGMSALAADNSSSSPLVSVGMMARRRSSTSSGPSHARARMTAPAFPRGAASCQRGAWRNSTVRPPKRSFRLRPEVRWTSRTGFWVVSPSWFAAAPPQGTMVSPHSAPRASTALPTLGGQESRTGFRPDACTRHGTRAEACRPARAGTAPDRSPHDCPDGAARRDRAASPRAVIPHAP